MAGVAALRSIDPDPVFSLIFDDDADATITKDIGAGPVRVHAIEVVSANVAISYLHLWNNPTPVIGTTPQDVQLPIPANATCQFVFLDGGDFPGGLSFAVTSDKGTTASASPVTPVDVRISGLKYGGF